MANGDTSDAAARRAAVKRGPGTTLPGGAPLPTVPDAASGALAAKKSMNAETKKRLAVAGAAGAVGFWFGGPIGAALGAAGGYAFMVIKKQGIGFGG